uniref:peptide-methionine (S)-S-oxide reductase n=1 Tax=Apteryx owenii TaxID=8824 RepID=A0A8B9QFG8_APTOW
MRGTCRSQVGRGAGGDVDGPAQCLLLGGGRGIVERRLLPFCTGFLLAVPHPRLPGGTSSGRSCTAPRRRDEPCSPGTGEIPLVPLPPLRLRDGGWVFLGFPVPKPQALHRAGAAIGGPRPCRSCEQRGRGRVLPKRAGGGPDPACPPLPATHAVNGNPTLPPFPAEMQVAIFGMGCFWGAERLFWKTPGVFSTQVGYAGGFTPNPTYKEVRSGLTGHAEVVRVVFDPQKISYEDLLKLFWENHDPTQGMRQQEDVGTQYRSVIYTLGPEQGEAARRSMAAYQEVGGGTGPDFGAERPSLGLFSGGRGAGSALAQLGAGGTR